MTFDEFIEKDKRLFYSIKRCDTVIDNPATDINTKIVALSERTKDVRKREELYDQMYWQHYLEEDE